MHIARTNGRVKSNFRTNARCGFLCRIPSLKGATKPQLRFSSRLRISLEIANLAGSAREAPIDPSVSAVNSLDGSHSTDLTVSQCDLMLFFHCSLHWIQNFPVIVLYCIVCGKSVTLLVRITLDHPVPLPHTIWRTLHPSFEFKMTAAAVKGRKKTDADSSIRDQRRGERCAAHL